MAETINQVQFAKVMIVGPSGYIADTNSSGQLMTTGSGGGGSGTVTSVATSGIATGGPISTSGTVTVLGSGNTATAATANTNLAGAVTGDIVTTDGSGNVQDSGTLLSSLAPKASPTFTGTVTESNLHITGTLEDGSSSVGTSGQLLSSTASGIKWVAPASQAGLTTVTYSATPTFNAALSSGFQITLSGNVTSSTLSNATAGQ